MGVLNNLEEVKFNLYYLNFVAEKCSSDGEYAIGEVKNTGSYNAYTELISKISGNSIRIYHYPFHKKRILHELKQEILDTLSEAYSTGDYPSLLCKYCSWTDYGSGLLGTGPYNMCEGAGCESAFDALVKLEPSLFLVSLEDLF